MSEEPKPNLEATENPAEYQKCLEDCTRSFRVIEESDKGLLVNCRNECVSLYSKRVKEMRKRYYRDQDSD